MRSTRNRGSHEGDAGRQRLPDVKRGDGPIVALLAGADDILVPIPVLAGTARRPLPTSNLWIAASALENGSLLVTRDEHFRSVPGLNIRGA